jgi:hypothetical protein
MDDQRTDREGSGTNRVRFSLKALLILIALIAIGFGIYHFGHHSGYKAGYKAAVEAANPVITPDITKWRLTDFIPPFNEIAQIEVIGMKPLSKDIWPELVALVKDAKPVRIHQVFTVMTVVNIVKKDGREIRISILRMGDGEPTLFELAAKDVGGPDYQYFTSSMTIDRVMQLVPQLFR